MSEGASAGVTDPYSVRAGDTLSGIARRCGKSVTELQRYNRILNPNQLDVGQTLYLSERSAFGVSALFLDALRHPIQNLPFQLRFDGRTVSGKTGANGQAPRQITRDAKSQLEVWVRNTEGAWQQVAQTASGYGHKLLTLVSGAIVVPGKTEAHPQAAPLPPMAPTKLAEKKAGPQPPLPKPASGASAKNNPAVRTKRTKGPQGQPVLQIGVDLPLGLLEHFAKFKGGEITAKEWTEAANRIECEAAVLQAFAEVESGGRSSFWRLNKADGANIPALLYERHYFSRLTNHKHDAEHPDISWPSGYRKKSLLGKDDKKLHDGRIDADDVYSDYASAYLRLINAYRLDPDAALKSCSWGKFQIMGDNFRLCSSEDIGDFVDSMCTSELKQIALVAEFIRNKPRAWKVSKNKALGKEISLWDAVKTKNWQAIAFNYNGPGYKTFNYDTKLKAAYEKYRNA